MTDPHALTQAFCEAFRCHPAGIAVITAAGAHGPVALTVSSLISVSATPPVVAFSLSARSSSAAALLAADTMVVHFLRYCDQSLAQLCATPGAQRFGDAEPWERLPTGEPRYTRVTTWFRARVAGTLEQEDATLVTARLLDGTACPPAGTPEAETLVYLDRRWHRLGQGAGTAA